MVNFSYNLGQIMTRYDSYGLDEWFWAMFELIWTWPNFTFGQFCMWIGQIMTRYDFLWARWVILSNVRTDLNLTYFTFGQLCMWIGANNDQIPYGLDEWFWAMFEPTWTWPNLTFGHVNWGKWWLDKTSYGPDEWFCLNQLQLQTQNEIFLYFDKITPKNSFF